MVRGANWIPTLSASYSQSFLCFITPRKRAFFLWSYSWLSLSTAECEEVTFNEPCELTGLWMLRFLCNTWLILRLCIWQVKICHSGIVFVLENSFLYRIELWMFHLHCWQHLTHHESVAHDKISAHEVNAKFIFVARKMKHLQSSELTWLQVVTFLHSVV